MYSIKQAHLSREEETLTVGIVLLDMMTAAEVLNGGFGAEITTWQKQ